MARPTLQALTLSILLAGAAVSAADEPQWRMIYGGPDDASHWATNGGKPLPSANATDEGINPHASGGYVVVYETPLKDFALDFDYKLTKGCNSGVFLRVGKLDDPVNTGLEVALDDTTESGLHDTGAIYDLVAPTSNPQVAAGEWNHMTIEASGPTITVTLNGKKVTTLNHDQFPDPGKRPDGSSHKFGGVAIKDLNQVGYFGFQDHGSDCWFDNVRVREIEPAN